VIVRPSCPYAETDCRDRLHDLAPPNRGGFNSTHIHGTHVPVEAPSTASTTVSRLAQSSEPIRHRRGRSPFVTCGEIATRRATRRRDEARSVRGSVTRDRSQPRRLRSGLTKFTRFLQCRPVTPRMRSAAFSPIMIEGALVLPLVTAGMIEASATRRPSIP
jgi:hypothetical protein